VNLLGPLDELLKEEAARREAEAREKNIFGRLTRSLSQTMKLGGGGSSSHVKKVSGEGTGVEFHMDELLTVRILGTGRFGKVKLVQHAVSNMAYALKILNKQIVEDLHAQKAAFAECDFLRSIDHPFVPALYGTFQDEACLYMLLEMLPGGDFWTILYDHRHWTHLEKTSLGGIELSAAKFYFSNILSAVAYLHKKDIIYRDLKPENMVISRLHPLLLLVFVYH
jgi:serine/threonine protein kinase